MLPWHPIGAGRYRRLGARMRPRRPGLRPTVTVIAAILVLAAALVTADDAAQRVTQAAADESARSAETVVRASVDPLIDALAMAGRGSDSGESIDGLLERLVQPGGIQRIKVWSPTGTVVYSDLAALRGRTFAIDGDLREALEGTISSTLHRNGTSGAENVLDVGLPADLFEIYLPLRRPDGSILGAYEIYEDASATVAIADATRLDVFVVAGLAASVLLVLLWLAFAATSRLLAARNRSLAELAADLRGRESRFRSLVQHSSDASAIVGPDGRVRYESVAVERILGRPAGSIEGRAFETLIHDEDRNLATRMLAELMATPGGERRFECRMPHADGSWRTMEIEGRNLLDDPAVAGIVLNHRDITKRRDLETELTRQAFHDSLTGLANRALFADRVNQAMRRQRRRRRQVAVMYLDVDDFKSINDSLGHDAGDRVLQAIADRLRLTVRPGDTVARLGGDEFVLLLDELSGPDDASEIARRVVSALAVPLAVGATDIVLKASIGIVLVRNDSAVATDLLRDADVAMYAVKARGGDGFEWFEPSMREATVARFSLGTDLRGAIERGELDVHYQPIVDLATGRARGLEALVRWNHPVRGPVAPVELIPVAEATGLVVPMGRLVLETACRQVGLWQAAFGWPELSMSVNLSTRELREPGLVDGVDAILRRTGVDPSTIILEITESIMVEDADGAIGTLHDLRRLGVRLAIDDFGTGYSSLSYLRRLPVDILKLDRSFVATAGSGERESALIEALFRLGRSLGLATVAEGIEDEGQRERLLQLGCRIAQGFLFARPMAEPAATAWLAEQAEARGAGAGPQAAHDGAAAA